MAGSIQQLWSVGLITSLEEKQVHCKARQHRSLLSPCVTSPQPHAPETHDERASFLALLRSCTRNKDLYNGSRLHDDILQRGLVDKFSDALVTMYAKCGALAKAKALLDTHKCRDVISWTALIAGYAREGRSQDALDCYERMQGEGVSPNAVTYASILKACGELGAEAKGIQIHDEIARQDLLQNDIVLGNALVDMYAKCRALVKAEAVHEKLPSRDVVSWNALIAGYATQGQGEQALNCFERMRGEAILPNAVTYTCILKACGSIGAADKGEQIHKEIASHGLMQSNMLLGSALVDMYAKCGALAKAQRVLDELPSRNVVCWSSLIAGYAQQGQGEQALTCFKRMQREGIPPNAVTYNHILKACGTIGAVDRGEQIHDEIVTQGFLRGNVVLGSALVDMYAKCGALAKAQQVLEDLPFRNVVSWSALISGYAQQGQGEQALNCYERMQCEGILPNVVTYTSILKACGSIGAADKGKQVHDEIARQDLLGDNIVLGSALVDMYAKCGALENAQCVLDELPSRNIVAWNALIAGYAHQGRGEQALHCFQCMQHDGISPDAVTFSCVLNVCSHLGLLEEGYMFFVEMTTKYGIKPDLEACTCMIDLFGRAGQFEKAVRLIREMPSSDYSAIWHALLGACSKWGEVEVGRWAFNQAIQVDKKDGAAHVMMANIYAAAGMQERAKSIEAMRVANKAWQNQA